MTIAGAPLAVASFDVPAEFRLLSNGASAELDGRKLVVYADPSDSDLNCFLLITPVRGDYTGLGSFGGLEMVAETIMPRGDGIENKLLSQTSAAGRYTYEYVVSVPDQPKRRTSVFFLKHHFVNIVCL